MNTRKYETGDIKPRGAIVFGIVLVAAIAASGLLMRGTFLFLQKRSSAAQPPPLSNVVAAEEPPAPQAWSMTPRDDLRRFRARNDARLNSYGWADRDARLVHIPIEEAMERLLRERRR